MHAAGNHLAMQFEMSQLVGNGESLAIGVVQGIDADDRHTILDVHHAGQFLVEWRKAHLGAEVLGDFLQWCRYRLNAEASKKLAGLGRWINVLLWHGFPPCPAFDWYRPARTSA